MTGSRTAIAFLAAGLLWGCAARSPAVSPPATGGQSMAVTADAATPEGRSAILDAVRQILAENFASGTGPGEDPELALEAARPALVQTTDAAAFYSALNETLSVSRSNHLYAFRPGRDLYDRDTITVADNQYRPKDAPRSLKGSGETNNGYSTMELFSDGSIRITGQRQQQSYGWT